MTSRGSPCAHFRRALDSRNATVALATATEREEHDVQPGQYGAAFAQWLANLPGRPITGEPVDGQGPKFTAAPEGVDS